MSDDDITAYIDDILEELKENAGKDVSRDELEKELKRFLEYGVPADHAKQTLVKKYTTTPQKQISTERTLIVDLKPNVPSVHILARIVSINPREITVKGEQRTIHYGVLGDESGTVPFTAWKDFEVSKGDVVDVTNAYTKEWQGTVKVNFGDRTRLTRAEDCAVPPLGAEPRVSKIKDLYGGQGGVEIIGRILDITERQVEASGQQKKVFSGLIGDETGKAQFTAWHDFHLTEGAVIKIAGGYVKTWKGIPQLTFDEKATVETVDGALIPATEMTAQKLTLADLVERTGALDVEVEATVIEIRRGSGVVLRCPQCNRVLQEAGCSVHGAVEGVPDLRLKLTLDDGTGSVGAILGRELSEKLLGRDLASLQTSQEADKEVDTALFGHRLCVSGNALGDDFGVTIIAKDAAVRDYDVAKEAEALAKDLEDLP
jgi:replication factor A1